MNAPERMHPPMVDAAHGRRADHLIEPLFLKRWSPRAFDASNIALADLLRVLEAARWAPSAYNVQPWRFVYGLRSDAVWQHWLGLLDPFNAAWAGEASALVFLLSDRLMPARAEAILQTGNVLADHGFGHVQLVGRGGVAAAIDHLDVHGDIVEGVHGTSDWSQWENKFIPAARIINLPDYLEDLSRDQVYELAFIGGSRKLRGSDAVPLRPIAIPLRWAGRN